MNRVSLTVCAVLLLGALVACGSGTPAQQQFGAVRIAVDLPAGGGDITTLGVPTTQDGVSGITEASVSVYRDGTLLSFDADGNEDPLGSSAFLFDPVAGGVLLNLMFGSYEFRLTAGAGSDFVLARGSAEHVVDGDVTLRVPLVSEIGSAELIGPVLVQAEALFDVFLHVMPPGHEDLWVPTTDFVAVYEHEGVTAVGSSAHGIRFDASVACEPFELSVQIYRPGALDEVLTSADLSIGEEVVCPVVPGGIAVDVEPPQLVVGPLPAVNTVGFQVELAGTVHDNGGAVLGVEVYDGPILLGEGVMDESVNPHSWQFSWTPLAARNHDLRFVAVDEAGNQQVMRFPAEVSNQAVLTTVSAGGSHACGLSRTGTAYCWGRNALGQLGTGDNSNRLVATKVGGSWEFVQIAAAANHTCGLTSDGIVACWGDGNQGRLGNGATASSNVPVEVSGDRVFTQLEAGAVHACARSEEGDWYCWGSGSYGQLGNNDTAFSTVPVLVPDSADFESLATGSFHTCGLTSTGLAYCWGNGADGQLGQGFFESSLTPLLVGSALALQSLTAGQNHTCGITTDGKMYCWGRGEYGRLGNGTSGNAASPVPVAEPLGTPRFESVSGGVYNTCAVTEAAKAYCWGYGPVGAIGNNDSVTVYSPIAVDWDDVIAQISVSDGFVCALDLDGRAYCWGEGEFGKLGNGDDVYNQYAPDAVVVATDD